MRSNAIMRIVIWSIVILILVGVMCSVMLGFNRVDVTEDVLPVTEQGESVLYSGTVTEELNVRSSPSPMASAIASLHPGTVVQIIRREAEWGFITSPEQGWIHMEYVKLNPASETVVAAAIPEPGEKDTFAADEIQEIEIEWVAGDILIQPHDTDTITIREDGSFDSKYAMVWKCRNGTLEIQFCEEGVANYFGVNTRSDLSKDLTIYVPRDWECESLEIDTASSKVEVNDMIIRSVEFDGASGTCEFENCTVDELDIDTASGDVRFIGNLDILDCDAASASIFAVLTNTPSRLDMDTMSGDLDITLPADAGFTISLDGMNPDFTSDFETTVKNGNHVCGDGRCRINIDAMSGDVIIRKDESMIIPAETTAAEHHHTEACTTNPASCPDHAAEATTGHHEESPNHF